mmetsp:Transcript_6011/g.12591  ORF Transcript_6011/g.12591 Transcript_6011/m.12591 type:complete len:729 (-) Transcript_6011:177-2363(-)|eukprot:CAMPEP_0178560838 /NCGR_PEP_ID=MMETSP0697-20121206/11698_1 /TAXON_ID=265572 /ORGANISM="Extubocellulus spinifer, Strain CCMP396" /LENGTH=728 /DNA_ID=CAMNT_0020194117 /DNA_START=264 /DNA_END=2450 /DNA_ORIENTATION=-
MGNEQSCDAVAVTTADKDTSITAEKTVADDNNNGPDDTQPAVTDSSNTSSDQYDASSSSPASSAYSSPPKSIVPSVRSSRSSQDLHKNMMRHVKNRDPFSIYEVTELLGVGSMGSVSKVRKRRKTIGGSARPHNRSSRFDTVVCDCNPVTGTCSSVPIVGGIFRACCGRRYRSTRNRNRGHDSMGLQSAGDSTRSEQTSASVSESIRTSSSRSANIFSAFSRRENLFLPSRGSTSTGFGGDASDRLSGSLHVRRGERYEITLALKSIHLSRVTDETFVNELKNEIDLLRSLDHPHIVRPIEVFEYRNQLYFTMEALAGGDLYVRDPYSEDEAAKHIYCIISAIAYMHSKKVVHRDLKYENCMFVNKSPNATVKLIDFGLSKRYGKDYLRDGVGTIYTMSPEVLRGSYTSKADCWSIGVLLYMLLSSQMPFYGKKRRHVVEKIMQNKYNYHGRRWKKVSPEARTLVDSLLQADPDKRLSADEALQHEWLALRTKKHEDASEVEVMDNVQATIQNFADYSKLKKLALMVIAHRSTSDEIGFLRRAFEKYDRERTGIVTLQEFKSCLADYGYSDIDLEKMFMGCDIDGTGQIRYTEFLAATIEAHGAIHEEKIAEAFDRLDADDSGFISTKNLREILGKDFPLQDIDFIVDEADITGDGRISYEEFLCLFDKQEEERRVEALRLVSARRTRNSVVSLPATAGYSSPSTPINLSERSYVSECDGGGGAPVTF